MRTRGTAQTIIGARQAHLTQGPPMPAPMRVTRDEDGDLSRSPYTNKFPTFSPPVFGGFTSITVPDGTAAAAAGLSYWFGLIDIAIDDALGQEGYLWGVTMTQLSTEPDATGTNLVWGDTFGNAAALVVGFNLPITGRPGVWVQSPCTIPGVESSPGTQTSLSGTYLHWETFPPGSINTTGFPYKRITPRIFSPFVYRYPEKSRLQAALVVRGSQVVNASGAPKTLRGLGEVKLHVGLTANLSGWTN